MLQVKSRVRRSFANASASYDYVAKLQAKAGSELLQQIDSHSAVDRVLDLGCGTGFLTHELLAGRISHPIHVVALDIALPMLSVARSKLSFPHASYLCADAESLPIQGQTFDLVMSNFALQWCEDLSKAMVEIKRVLKPEGRLLFNTFGESTLHELKSAWQTVDDYAHVNTFVSVAQLREILNKAGFHLEQLKTENHVSLYESVWDLMAELKQLGAQTVVTGKNRQLTTKTAMQQMIQAYQKQKTGGLIPATFEVLSVVAKTL